jgi:uncharacterized membrane protein YeaQ/YmgE (transglycosylase-associated protein family)
MELIIILGILVLAAAFFLSLFVAGVVFFVQLLGWILFGAVAGWIASKITNDDSGLLKNIVLGLIGSILGGILFQLLGFDSDGRLLYELFVAVVGATLLISLFRFVSD